MPDLAMMLAGVAAHQAASPTAHAQNRLIPELPLAVASFNAEVAVQLSERQCI